MSHALTLPLEDVDRVLLSKATCEAKLRELRAMVSATRGAVEPPPIERSPGGWPIFRKDSGVVPLPDDDSPYDPRD